MIKDIVRDPMFLSRRSESATADDIDIAADLIDTLRANSEYCVGMAANMIGFSKNIIAFSCGDRYTVMLNPEIISCTNAYAASEGCLSLDGVKSVKRYGKIKVRYQNEAMQTRIATYTGFTAQIIQHEIDHCNGILV